MRFKLKGIVTGKVIDHTVRAGTKMESADVTTQPMQYLYQQGEDFIFMDLDSYDQIPVSAELIGFGSNFLMESTEVQVTMFEESAIGVQLPQKMEFEITETIDDADRGNTATNATKEATLQTGLLVMVPLFVKTGDRVRVSTEDGSYLERA